MQTVGKRGQLLFCLMLFAGLMFPDVVTGQTDTEVNSPADTSSPLATLNSFIDNCNEFFKHIEQDEYFDRSSPVHRPYVMRVIDCLDVSQLPEFEQIEAAGEVAVYLKEILDRVNLPPDEEIPGFSDESNVDESNTNGGEPVSRWRIPKTRITIARVEEGPRKHEYLFSTGTVARAKELFHDRKSTKIRTTGRPTTEGFYEWYFTAPGDPYVAKIVSSLSPWWRVQVFEMARWKWAGLFLAALISITLMVVCYRFYFRLTKGNCEESPIRFLLTIVFPVAAMLIPLGYRYAVFEFLTLRGTVLYGSSFMSTLVTVFASIVVVFGLSNRIAALIIASPRINPQGLDAQFIRILCKLLSIVVSMIVFLYGGQYVGIDATTLIAGAGVGGFAVALAAQDTLKNLFGTIMLLTDKPFRVGERIVFGKYDGVVEEIGLRSTRIRLLTGHLVTVPNNELANTDIENVAQRPFIKQSSVLELPSETSVDEVKRALEIVRSALKDHEGMNDSYPPRVFFRDLKDSSIGVVFIFWYHPPEYWDFLAFCEKVNMTIMENLETAKIPFAAPALYVHIEDRNTPMN